MAAGGDELYRCRERRSALRTGFSRPQSAREPETAQILIGRIRCSTDLLQQFLDLPPMIGVARAP